MKRKKNTKEKFKEKKKQQYEETVEEREKIALERSRNKI